MKKSPIELIHSNPDVEITPPRLRRESLHVVKNEQPPLVENPNLADLYMLGHYLLERLSERGEAEIINYEFYNDLVKSQPNVEAMYELLRKYTETDSRISASEVMAVIEFTNDLWKILGPNQRE